MIIMENKRMTRKEAAICPNCGQWNYKPPHMEREKVLDEYGIEHYVLFSLVKYKCTCCKIVWTERWDYEKN